MVDLSPKTVLEESVQDVGDVLATIKDNIDAKSYLWVESLIDDKYTKRTYQAAAEEIAKQGWYGVAWQTSAENGERPGLVDFFLFESEEIFNTWASAFGKNRNNPTYHIKLATNNKQPATM